MPSAKSYLLVALLIVSGMLAGCATPYQPKKGHGFGYSDVQLDNDSVKVSFSGNGDTSKDTVENYALFRCAEVTLQRGFDYFSIIETVLDKDVTVTQSIPQKSEGKHKHSEEPKAEKTKSDRVLAVLDILVNDDKETVTTTTSSRYESTLYIRLFRGKKPKDRSHTYDARELMQNLAPHIKW